MTKELKGRRMTTPNAMRLGSTTMLFWGMDSDSAPNRMVAPQVSCRPAESFPWWLGRSRMTNMKVSAIDVQALISATERGASYDGPGSWQRGQAEMENLPAPIVEFALNDAMRC